MLRGAALVASGLAAVPLCAHKVLASSQQTGRSINELSVYENPESRVELVPKPPSALQTALSPALRRTREIWSTSKAHTQGLLALIDEQPDAAKVTEIAVGGMFGVFAATLLRAKGQNPRGFRSRLTQVLGLCTGSLLVAAVVYPNFAASARDYLPTDAKQLVSPLTDRSDGEKQD